jgi:hypothetical protein
MQMVTFECADAPKVVLRSLSMKLQSGRVSGDDNLSNGTAAYELGWKIRSVLPTLSASCM